MVSVAAVTYNGEKYIREQLDSILANLTENDEVIISDDGSSDRTLVILQDYAGRDGRIRLLEGPRQGVIANVEHALKECRGDYIFLADQDDVWMPDKVASVLAVFQEQGAVLVMHDAKVMDAACKEVIMPSFFAYRKSKKGAVNNIVKNRYMGCCMAFSREVLSEVLPIPKEIQMHDQWIGVVCDLKYHRTSLLPKPLICYRRHASNVSDFSRNSFGIMVKNRLVFLRALYKKHKRKGAL